MKKQRFYTFSHSNSQRYKKRKKLIEILTSNQKYKINKKWTTLIMTTTMKLENLTQ